jgi:hypothetical protein
VHLSTVKHRAIPRIRPELAYSLGPEGTGRVTAAGRANPKNTCLLT